MRYLLHQLQIPLDYQEADFAPALAKKLGCKQAAFSDIKALSRSIDARAKGQPPHFIFSFSFILDEKLVKESNRKSLELVDETQANAAEIPKVLDTKSRPRPVVVGAGPAGLMAAFALADAGLKPLLVERGDAVEGRKVKVREFWQKGILDAESNTLYGEGGAGLYSDGKLTSRSKDSPRLKRFLETLVACGAPEDILIDHTPHLGSDQLAIIVPRLREKIIELGGEVRFLCRLDKIEVDQGQLKSVTIAGEKVATDACILATGHSARDVYKMLSYSPVTLEPKSFAIGVRLELPQSVIDRAQYKDWAGHPALGVASFRLTAKVEKGFRACYSFCMCPGGMVISCASSAGKLTTNGMSLSKRDLKCGNAAFIVPVAPDDIPVTHENEPAILDGYKFQEEIETKAFIAGGSDYTIPASRLSDFLSKKISVDLPKERSADRAIPADLWQILPKNICETLAHAIPLMLKKLPGSNPKEVVLYGAETRSSSPIRITRGKDGHSLDVRGIYPSGEGAGYAGGIVSAGIDGLRAAQSVIQSYL
ncbi:MAG: FAD-dependent oxidoreductase [SAR324 cluster bacterium]|nr:FAD-dependent oxidoreductase [SAR324 cluster bacterium]